MSDPVDPMRLTIDEAVSRKEWLMSTDCYKSGERAAWLGAEANANPWPKYHTDAGEAWMWMEGWMDEKERQQKEGNR